MAEMLTRRMILNFAATACVVGCGSAGPTSQGAAPPRPRPRAAPTVNAQGNVFVEIEQRIGGRVGVFMFDAGTGKSLEHRARERFAMCSTFKWVLAAAVLTKVDRGELSLSQDVAFSAADLLEYAPETRRRVANGKMTIEELAQASVEVSDNTAANLLLAQVGGPSGLTQFIRGVGDNVTRLDRTEPTLNTNLPGDERDTTSPYAMATLLAKVLTGPVLTHSSQERLIQWLVACTTGDKRLRASLPADWKAGDKTGSGANGACNDVAVCWPPQQAPRFAAVYLSDSQASLETLNSAHAEIGRILATM